MALFPNFCRDLVNPLPDLSPFKIYILGDQRRDGGLTILVDKEKGTGFGTSSPEVYEETRPWSLSTSKVLDVNSNVRERGRSWVVCLVTETKKRPVGSGQGGKNEIHFG